MCEPSIKTILWITWQGKLSNIERSWFFEYIFSCNTNATDDSMKN